MLARRPTRSCDFKVLNKMLISYIIGLQLFIAKIQGTQQFSDLEVGCVEGIKNGLICRVYKRHSIMHVCLTPRSRPRERGRRPRLGLCGDSLFCELTLTAGRQEAAKTSAGQEEGQLKLILIFAVA